MTLPFVGGTDLNNPGVAVNFAFGGGTGVASDPFRTEAGVLLSPPTTLLNGLKNVTTAGTRVPIAASSTPVRSVTIKARDDNTGVVYLGNSTVASSNGFRLLQNDSESFDFADLANVYIDAANNGDGVTFLAVL